METQKNLSYDNTIGERGLYDLYLPDAGMPCEELFIYIHGGGIEAGSKDGNYKTWEILVNEGTAAASINYRLFPDGAKFPSFIQDCAKAVSVISKKAKELRDIHRIYVGGSSAGGYLSMMLFFDPEYLAAEGMTPNDVDGWFFDAGQPTAHFGILQRNGVHPLAVRVDETAPIYYLDHPYDKNEKLPRLHFIWSEFDMACRPEQNALMVRELKAFGYPEEKLTFRYMEGYKHCQYVGDEPLFAKMILEFVKN